MQAGLAPLRQVPASGHELWEPPAAVVQPSDRHDKAPGEQQAAANFEDLARTFAASAGGLSAHGSRSSSPGYSPSEDSRDPAGAGEASRLQAKRHFSLPGGEPGSSCRLSTSDL